MATSTRLISPGFALLAVPLSRLKTAVAQEHSDPEELFEKIHLRGAQEQRCLNDGDVIRSVPLFPLGRNCFIPHSGTEKLHVFEPRYRKLYLDMLGWSARLRWPFFKHVEISFSLPWQQASQRTRPRLVNVWMDIDEEGKFISSVGVLLDVSSWNRIGLMPPRYNAVHQSGSRVRILRILNPEAGSNTDAYLMADIEVIRDTPQATEHADILQAWRAVWISIRALVELQTKLNMKPRLSKSVLDLGRDRTVLFPNACWLDAEDVWRPLGIVQQFYNMQIFTTHKNFRQAIRMAQQAGGTGNGLKHAYDLELQRLDAIWQRIHGLLQQESLVEMLWQLSHMVDAEVQRIELSHSSTGQAE